MIKTVTVTLYERTLTSDTDDFGAPVYTETPVSVPGVLVTPVSAEDVVSDLQLYGKRAEYELCIPKGDAHSWEGCRISFFGKEFRAFTPVVEYIEANVPLRWNRKVKVERYG